VRLVQDAERALVIVSATRLAGRENLHLLYKVIDAAGTQLARAIGEDRYDHVVTISGPEVTPDRLVAELTQGRAGVNAVDLVLMVHGEPGEVILADADGKKQHVAVAALAAQIQAVPAPRPQLRLCYSTACFGASHNESWLEAGFRAAIGAVATNSSSGTEMPTLLHLWVTGHTVKDALQHADNDVVRKAADFTAHHVLGFKDADSRKVLAGDAALTIDS
jgi:hypothetical protein